MEGGRRVGCESPIKQNQRHLKLFEQWVKANTSGGLSVARDSAEWLFGVVLVYRAKWLKVNECTMPVYQSATTLAWNLKRRQKRSPVLSPEQVEAIAIALSHAKPYAAAAAPSPRAGRARPAEAAAEVAVAAPSVASPAGVHTGKSKDGRNYARVTGSKDEAEKIRAGYALQGRQTSPVQKDRFKDDAWFFYWE